MTKIIKVTNVSPRAVEVAGVEIKPRKTRIFQELTSTDKAKISALVAIGTVKMYEEHIEDTQANSVKQTDTVNNNIKQTKKTKKK